MYPQGYPTEAVPLQAVSYGGLPGQPGVVQHTAVNITAGQQVITERPKDHIIWSLFSLVYANPFCFGLAALIYSIKARDRKVVGDVDGARRYGSTARCLNIISTIIVSTVFLALIIGITVLTTTIVSYRTANLNSPREQYGFSY
uniref:Dispanin subfamily A member 2b-like n=1 Tax=Maylandia zebra TaxID=106582 RepID=A0A3P9BYB3_9CICH